MNDRAIKVRRDFRRSLVQPPAYSWTSSEIWSCCSMALYSLVLITSRGTDSTISLSTLFHCSTGFMINLFSVCLLYPVWVAPWSLSFFANCLSAFHYAQLTTQLWRAWHCRLTKAIAFSWPSHFPVGPGKLLPGPLEPSLQVVYVQFCQPLLTGQTCSLQASCWPSTELTSIYQYLSHSEDPNTGCNI